MGKQLGKTAFIMFCILNELSIAPNGVLIKETDSLLKSLIDTFYLIKPYKLEQIKAPPGFSNMKIAGGLAINEYRQKLEDPDERQRIIGFLSNVVDDFSWDYQQELANAEAERMFETLYGDQVSQSLKDANVCQLPLLSFETAAHFQVNLINGQQYILDDKGDRYVPISLENFHNQQSVAFHHEYLLRICQNIILEKKKWNPYSNPSWRSDVTKKIIEDSKYPKYTGKESTQEKRAKNTAVVIEILKANGWIFDYNVTTKNNHRHEIWKIFTNNLTRDNVYISIDLVEGEFEIQDRRGKWVNTTFFDGTKNEGKNYTKDNSHNIIVK